MSAATIVTGLASIGDISGVFSALMRELSRYKANNQRSEMWSSFWTALLIEILVGAGLTLVALLISGPLSILIGKPQEAPFFRLASLLTFAFVVTSVDVPVMISLGLTGLYGRMQIIDQVILTLFPIVPVVLGYGAYGALVGLVVGNFLFMATQIYQSLRIIFRETSGANRKIHFAVDARRMIKFGFPLGVSSSLNTSFGQVLSLVVVKFVDIGTYGLYSIASSAVVIVGYVSYPISTMSFPILSRLTEKESRLLRSVYTYTIKYAAVAMLPVALFFILFATPFLMLLYGQSYAAAGIMLAILTVNYMEFGLGSATTMSLLSSQGYTSTTGKLNILSAGVSLIIRSDLASNNRLHSLPNLFCSVVVIAKPTCLL